MFSILHHKTATDDILQLMGFFRPGGSCAGVRYQSAGYIRVSELNRHKCNSHELGSLQKTIMA
jgi:hypothetical protein